MTRQFADGATSGAFGTPRLGNGRDTPSRLLAGNIPAKYRDRQKNVSPLWRRYGAFLSTRGFYFRVWRRCAWLVRAQDCDQAECQSPGPMVEIRLVAYVISEIKSKSILV